MTDEVAVEIINRTDLVGAVSLFSKYGSYCRLPADERTGFARAFASVEPKLRVDSSTAV